MTTERRKYFRIKDTALVKYRIVQEENLEVERRKVYLNQIKLENARAALFGLETDLQQVLEKVRVHEPSVAAALELVNRKINLLERVVSLEHPQTAPSDYFEHEPREIDLSGGGMAIRADCPLATGANLAIDLVLLPVNDPMRVFGKVVESRKADDGDYAISIVFEEIRQEDQDKLIQHIMRRQATDLRRQRQPA